MRKIATPNELLSEIQKIAAYTASENPSRSVIAAKLADLTVRVAVTGEFRDYTTAYKAIENLALALIRTGKRGEEQLIDWHTMGEGERDHHYYDTVRLHSLQSVGANLLKMHKNLSRPSTKVDERDDPYGEW